MAIIKRSEIAGFTFGNPHQNVIVCRDCLIKEEWLLLELSELLIISEIDNEDTLYFCDRCGFVLGIPEDLLV